MELGCAADEGKGEDDAQPISGQSATARRTEEHVPNRSFRSRPLSTRLARQSNAQLVHEVKQQRLIIEVRQRAQRRPCASFLARDEMKGAKCEVRRLHTLSLACAPRGVEGSSAEATRVSGEGGPADEQCARRGCSCDASASAAIAVATRSVSARAGAVRAARGARAAAACLVHRVGQVDHVRAASNRLLSLDACESVTGRRTARRPLIDVRRGRRRACRTWR